MVDPSDENSLLNMMTSKILCAQNRDFFSGRAEIFTIPHFHLKPSEKNVFFSAKNRSIPKLKEGLMKGEEKKFSVLAQMSPFSSPVYFGN